MAFFQNSSILCLVLKDQKLPGVKQYSRRLDKGSKLIPLCLLNYQNARITARRAQLRRTRRPVPAVSNDTLKPTIYVNVSGLPLTFQMYL